jgi:glycosyltransferase involved in cell wall biosynthesis
MKVRVLAPFPPPFGGVALHCVRLLEALRSKDIDATGVSQGGLPLGISGISRFGFGFFLSRSMVHYHTDEGNHRWMRLLSWYWWLTRTPYIVTVHSFRHRPEFDDPRVRRALADAYIHAKAVIGISDEVIRDLELRIGVRHKLTRTIASNLPISTWERSAPFPPTLDAHWKNGAVRLLANAGRIVRYHGKDLYGIDVLLDAMAMVSDADVQLCIAVGEIVDADLWTQLQERIAADGRIRVLQDSSTPLVPVVAHAHVIIRPTRTEGGPSLTLTEAIELGRWAIGSDAVERPAGTVTFINEDPSDLARALRQCISDSRRGTMPPAISSNIDAVQKIVNLYQRCQL